MDTVVVRVVAVVAMPIIVGRIVGLLTRGIHIGVTRAVVGQFAGAILAAGELLVLPDF